MRHGGVLKHHPSAQPVVFDALLGDDASGHPPVLRAVAPERSVFAGAQPEPDANEPRPEVRPRGAVVARQAVRVSAEARTLTPPSPFLRARAPSSTPPEPSPEEIRARQEAEARARRDAELAAARDDAYAEGYAAGHAEADAALRAEVEALKTAVGPDIERLGTLWKAHHDRVERQLVALAVEVAAMLTSGPLPEAAREAADRAFVQAIESITRGEGLSVHLHPVDFLRLQEVGLVDGLSAAHPALRWVPDDDLSEGDWVADSAEAVVRHVRAELLEGLRARLDLMQAIQDAPRVAARPAVTATASAPEALLIPTPVVSDTTPPAASASPSSSATA